MHRPFAILLVAALAAVTLSGCLGEEARMVPVPSQLTTSQSRAGQGQAQPGAAAASDLGGAPLAQPASPRPLAVDAGAEQVLRDTDGNGKEAVQLQGSAQARLGQVIQGYGWYEGATKLDDAPLVLVQVPIGVHTFRFAAAYADGEATGVAEDTVRVTVVGNDAPLAAAGPDQEAFDGDGDGKETFTLDGRGSTDPDGTLSAYEWRLGSTLALSAPAGTVTLGVGSHTLQLTVRDASGALATDTVQLQVGPNRPPTADAGRDFTAYIEGSAITKQVQLTGAGSDPDGLPLRSAWATEDEKTLSESVHASPKLGVGKHVLQFTVHDAAGASATDTVTVTVKKPVPLVAALGPSSCSGLVCSFDATPSSGEAPLSFAWDFGDATAGAGSKVSHPYAAGGTYTVRLTVTDAAGKSAQATLQRPVVRASVPITFTEVIQSTPLAGIQGGASYGLVPREGIDDAWVDLPADAQGRGYQLASTGGSPGVLFLASCNGGFAPIGQPAGQGAGTIPPGAGCALLSESGAVPSTVSLTLDLPTVPALGISSPAFQEGQAMPPQHTCTTGTEWMADSVGGLGAGTKTTGGVSPPLSLTAPPGAKSFVLVVYDSTAGGMNHWVVWDIPVPDGGRVELPAGASGSRMPPGSVEGQNDFGPMFLMGPSPGYAGYSGTCDFLGDGNLFGPHVFTFQLFALDRMLGFPSTANPYTVLFPALSDNMGFVRLTGTAVSTVLG